MENQRRQLAELERQQMLYEQRRQEILSANRQAENRIGAIATDAGYRQPRLANTFRQREIGSLPQHENRVIEIDARRGFSGAR